jgi:hypothetical protein
MNVPTEQEAEEHRKLIEMYGCPIEPPEEKELIELVSKFSRDPLWAAANKASEDSYPKWKITNKPKLTLAKGKSGSYAVYRYRIPHGKVREFSTGVKARTLSELPTPEISIELRKKYFFGMLNGMDFANENDAAKLWLARGKAIEAWHEDFFRMTVIFEAICAALAANWFVWNRWQDAGVSGMTEEERLEIIVPIFRHVGIDAKRVFELGFKAPPIASGKRPTKGKWNLPPLNDHFYAKLLKSQQDDENSNAPKKKPLRKQVKQNSNTSLDRKTKKGK